MHIHLIGVSGTGMGSLAGLLVEAGHQVSGSDVAFHPPMGPALQGWGVETREGWSPANLDPRPDMVVIGNVCRPTNPEAKAAVDGGFRFVSMAALLESMFLEKRPSYVVAGTHGKTTTSSLLAHLLVQGNRKPGYFIGGVPLNFGQGFSVGAQNAPFVLEGDEYDSAFFEKTPKFWRYRATAAILTSIEHDHIDIYPTVGEYLAAFHGFVERMSDSSLLVAFAGDPHVRDVTSQGQGQRVRYALDSDDCGPLTPEYLGCLAEPAGGVQPIDLFVRGSFAGRILSPLFGRHNARNVIATIAVATEQDGLPMAQVIQAVSEFQGVRRRQEWIGTVAGVHLYDDFAHHPTAVSETLRGVKSKHKGHRLIAVFEPRSATASRNLHQTEYVSAFEHADAVVLAPVGRSEIEANTKLDTARLAAELQKKGKNAVYCAAVDECATHAAAMAEDGDSILVMSNGAFGGIHDLILSKLAERLLAS